MLVYTMSPVYFELSIKPKSYTPGTLSLRYPANNGAVSKSWTFANHMFCGLGNSVSRLPKAMPNSLSMEVSSAKDSLSEVTASTACES